MYAVVGCNECQALWVVADRPDTTRCPRCGKRHQFSTLKQFATAEDETAAREARAALLADRQGQSDAFADLDSMAEMETRIDEAGVDDETYLSESGVDADAVAEAGERAEQGPGGGSSRRDTVLAALESLDGPSTDEVVAYAEERGVPADYTREALDRLVRHGEVTRSGDTYRLL
ncbi:MAG: DUF5817 domain-containing protein [Halobacteriaceae archaeon]